jgi:hypothetical protein
MISLLLALFLISSPTVTVTSLHVRHNHSLGGCEGTLSFTEDGVRYETKEKEHSRQWTYPDVKYFEIVSTHEIEIHTYESHGLTHLATDRDYQFHLLGEGEIDDSLYKLLVRKSPRAVVTHVVFHGTEVVQEIPVRHRHRLGGCPGTLTIATDKIIFRTDHKADSRIWQLDDIESFASSDKFSLRLSSRFETFTFDLKLPLEQKAYDVIWQAVYAMGIPTYRYCTSPWMVLSTGRIRGVLVTTVSALQARPRTLRNNFVIELRTTRGAGSARGCTRRADCTMYVGIAHEEICGRLTDFPCVEQNAHM